MSEEYLLPEDKDFDSKQDMYNSWLENNNLSHWECTDNLGMFFVRCDEKEYSNNKFTSSLKIPGYKPSSIIEQLKAFDKLYPIKQEPYETFA